MSLSVSVLGFLTTVFGANAAWAQSVPNIAEQGAEEPTYGELGRGWTYGFVFNRAFVFWDDGRRGTRFVDNDQDNTSLELAYERELSRGWKFGFTASLDLIYAGGNRVSQLDRAWALESEVGELSIEFGNESYGRIVIGHTDSSSDGTSNVHIDTIRSQVLADAEVDNWNASYFLRAPAGLTEVRWDDFYAGPDVGDTGRFISYFTPKWKGFEFGASIGQPQVMYLSGLDPDARVQTGPLYDDEDGGLFVDASIRYEADWNSVKFKSSLGAFSKTTEDHSAEEPTEDLGIGGGFAVLHVPSGLNLAMNAGITSHTDRCVAPGEESGRCRGDDRFFYVKGGIVRKLLPWGNTDFYVEYYQGNRSQNESDEEVLRALEANVDQATELSDSKMSVWGLGVVQTIDGTSRTPFDTDVYVGYRKYSLDIDLIGAGGASAAAIDVADFSAVMAGVRLRFGKARE